MNDYCNIVQWYCQGKNWNTGKKSHHNQTLSTINPTWFDLHSRWMTGKLLRRPDRWHGRSACLSVCLSVCLSRDAVISQSQLYSHRCTSAAIRASSHGAGRRRTAAWYKGASQCVPNQIANGALRDVAQTRHRRCLLSERHSLSQHTSQYKQTQFSMRHTHIVSAVTDRTLILK